MTDPFEKAIQILESKGWWQGSNRGPDGQVCALTALFDATGEHLAAYSRVRNVLARVLRVESVAEWNDHPRRKVREVTAALHKCVGL